MADRTEHSNQRCLVDHGEGAYIVVVISAADLVLLISFGDDSISLITRLKSACFALLN